MIFPHSSEFDQLFPRGDERTDLYVSKNPVVRHIFWSRLRAIAGMLPKEGGRCLDFGGGTGALLPTLSGAFRDVVCADMDTTLAEKIKRHFALKNVEVENADLLHPYHGQKFDAVVAADVLEHFKDLSGPIESIKARLRAGGRLYTSLPSENALYVLLRVVLRKQKPADHYHGAADVEARLRDEGFRRVSHATLPLRWVAPLFSVSEWECP